MFGDDEYGMGDCMASLAEDDFTSGGTSPGFFAGEEQDLDGPAGILPGLKALLGGGKTARVTAQSGLKLRSAPSENSAQLALLPLNTVVTVLEEGFPATPAASKGWTKVKAPAGEGFMSTEWLAISSASPSPFGPSPLAPTPPPVTPSSNGPIAPPSPPASASIVSKASGLSKWIWIGGGVVAVLAIGAFALGGKD